MSTFHVPNSVCGRLMQYLVIAKYIRKRSQHSVITIYHFMFTDIVCRFTQDWVIDCPCVNAFFTLNIYRKQILNIRYNKNKKVMNIIYVIDLFKQNKNPLKLKDMN